MRINRCVFVCLLVLAGVTSNSQPCTTIGQTPSTAFPVCGTSTFTQSTVPLCNNGAVPTMCAGAMYWDVNPYYYKFTCYTSGTLGFVLSPTNINDDYDWVLFDITGRIPNDIYADYSLNIAENWSGFTGNTGAAGNTNPLRNCAGNSPNFSRMPTITAGHQYLLMVSNWSASQLGYSLTFTGGTAVITDPLLPGLQNASIDCEGLKVTLRLNKKMKCSSLSANGSDFV